MFGLFGKDKVVVPTIHIAREFSSHLTYGLYNNETERKRSGLEFRERFLKELDNQEMWKDGSHFITLDFHGVERISPSFAYVTFAYFRKYACADWIKSKIYKTNLERIKRFTIEMEVEMFIEDHDPLGYLR